MKTAALFKPTKISVLVFSSRHQVALWKRVLNKIVPRDLRDVSFRSGVTRVLRDASFRDGVTRRRRTKKTFGSFFHWIRRRYVNSSVVVVSVELISLKASYDTRHSFAMPSLGRVTLVSKNFRTWGRFYEFCSAVIYKKKNNLSLVPWSACFDCFLMEFNPKMLSINTRNQSYDRELQRQRAVCIRVWSPPEKYAPSLSWRIGIQSA
jgi:hypothetical protein